MSGRQRKAPKQEERLGFNSLVWIEALYKRIIDGVRGLGGIEAFCQYLDQIDFIPEISKMRHRMKINSIFFESSLARCKKEMLNRPENIRQEEIFNSMGVHCRNPKCGAFSIGYTPFLLSNKLCPQCGERSLEPAYITMMRQLLNMKILPTPEAIIMSLAYDLLADAYVDAFQSLRLVMSKTAFFFNWDSFRLDNPGIRNYLDQYFLGRLSGETKIPREEKETLQFIVRANMANVPLQRAENLIRLAIATVKWGYIYEVLGCSGAHPYYVDALAKFNPLYDEINRAIRYALAVDRNEGKHTSINISKTAVGVYAPCFIMPKIFWESGNVSKDIQLEPLYKLDIFPKEDYGSLQAIFSRLGGGKTTLMGANLTYSILNKNELTFNPLGDKSNSFTLACLPLFGYDNRTNELLKILKEDLVVEPQRIPVLTITVLQKGENMPDHVAKHPPTRFDRILEVENPKSFLVDFNFYLDKLKEIADEFGYTWKGDRMPGLITVRNLDRYISGANVNIDVQIAITLMNQFDSWRKGHMKGGTRLLIDEISYMASSQVILYGADALRSGATISDFIKESRRDRSSVDCATQMPLEIIPEIRNAATNVWFRDLSMSKDRSKSQIDFLLESLQLKDPSIRAVVRDINNRGALPQYCWFYYNREERDINVVKPCPPTFCLQDPKHSNMEVFKLYQKISEEKILLDSWNNVPSDKAEHGTENWLL